MARPTLNRAAQAMYDWLAENGVDEWLPEWPLIEIGPAAIRYTAFEWATDDARGWNPEFIVRPNHEAVIVSRVVPLRVPLSPNVAAAAQLSGCALLGATGDR